MSMQADCNLNANATAIGSKMDYKNKKNRKKYTAKDGNAASNQLEKYSKMINKLAKTKYAIVKLASGFSGTQRGSGYELRDAEQAFVILRDDAIARILYLKNPPTLRKK